MDGRTHLAAKTLVLAKNERGVRRTLGHLSARMHNFLHCRIGTGTWGHISLRKRSCSQSRQGDKWAWGHTCLQKHTISCDGVEGNRHGHTPVCKNARVHKIEKGISGRGDTPVCENARFRGGLRPGRTPSCPGETRSFRSPPVVTARSQLKNNYFIEMCSDSEEGSYSRRIDFCIAQRQA